MQTGGTSIRFNLSATGIDTSAWVASKSGVWFGLGYGSNQMRSIDFNMCTFIWKNTATDAFTCSDSYYDANRAPLPPTSETQDLTGVITMTKDKAAGSFKVSFVRPITPSDISSGYDYSISLTTDTKMIWALGSVDSLQNPSQHNSGMDGAYTINFSTNNN